MSRRNRQPALDQIKQSEVLAIISMGCGINAAAEYVGCCAATIKNLAVKDGEFAARLAHAKSLAEVGLVKSIRTAANKEKYWRAAAWALERFFPDRYGKRDSNSIMPEQLALIVAQIADIIVEHTPNEKQQKKILKAIETIIRRLGHSISLQRESILGTNRTAGSVE